MLSEVNTKKGGGANRKWKTILQIEHGAEEQMYASL